MDGLGISAVVQASHNDPTAHVQGLFLPQTKQQTIMTSFHDVTVILLMKIGGNIKRLMHETREFGSGLGFDRLDYTPIVLAIPVTP